ncbi:ABC transporter ATP-binding protein [Fusibacter paucivorans]|uniref:ABC transporter ATP-binding protein n=1 Tax=Fusibacter paucivorans TaxID=76009 RepID=A0ABS5PPG5_9FIRM|nr:ATP-binding cassette domain-containing protein [Fusibacter paucivorans]MBS7526471.1 ABC transporter ATP-binding protein [Fusibacter paucivorans]
MHERILLINHLRKQFFVKPNLLKRGHLIDAVKDVSMTVYRGDILGIIGESGSGKTTLGEMILKLQAPTAGELIFDGIGMPFRKDVQIVMQQSNEVFDPLSSVEKILRTAIKRHHKLTKSEQDERIEALLSSVGMSPVDKIKKINQFSGGQLQRVCIARALAVEPKLLLLDEPVSALDVSVQGQIINLLMKLHAQQDLTYIIISHDLNVIKHMCNRIAVMKDGEMVELSDKETLFTAPKHAYTKQLIANFTL